MQGVKQPSNKFYNKYRLLRGGIEDRRKFKKDGSNQKSKK